MENKNKSFMVKKVNEGYDENGERTVDLEYLYRVDNDMDKIIAINSRDVEIVLEADPIYSSGSGIVTYRIWKEFNGSPDPKSAIQFSSKVELLNYIYELDSLSGVRLDQYEFPSSRIEQILIIPDLT